MRIPSGAEIQSAYKVESIAAYNAKFTAHIWQMAIRSTSVGFRYLCGDYTSALRVFESIGYQEWIATYLYYLIVGEIGGVPLVSCVRDQRDIDILLKKESC